MCDTSVVALELSTKKPFKIHVSQEEDLEPTIFISRLQLTFIVEKSGQERTPRSND